MLQHGAAENDAEPFVPEFRTIPREVTDDVDAWTGLLIESDD